MLSIQNDIREFKNSEEVSSSLAESQILIEALLLEDRDFSRLISDLSKEYRIEESALLDCLVLNLSQLNIHNEEIGYETLSFIAKFCVSSLKMEEANKFWDLISNFE